MSLRGNPVSLPATLPDGRTVTVRVGVPDDPYIAKRELDTVTVELAEGDEHLAAVNTPLDADQVSEARALAQELVRRLSSGELEPTAGAIEPLATTVPSV